MDPWLAGLLSAESVAVVAVVDLVLLVYLDIKIHLVSKQNARDHAELRESYGPQAESIERLGESIDHLREAVDDRGQAINDLGESVDDLRQAIVRRGASMNRRFDAIDRNLDQILSYLLRNRSDKDD